LDRVGVAGPKDPTSKTTYGVLVCSYATADHENVVILRSEQAYSASDSSGALPSTTVVAWDGVVEVQISTSKSSIEAVKSMIAKIFARVP